MGHVIHQRINLSRKVPEQKTKVKLTTVRDVVAQWLVHQTWDLKVETSSPGWCVYVVFLGIPIRGEGVEMFLFASYYINPR